MSARYIVRGFSGGCISAWAEEPPSRARTRADRPVHLRVGGGTAWQPQTGPQMAGASPRGRRNLAALRLHRGCVGCISAWAEEPMRETPGRS